MEPRFEVGSYVYYVALGICKVIGYESMGSDKENFVVLQSVNQKNPLKIFVPLDVEEQVDNISTPLDASQVEKVFKSDFIDMEWNSNKRERQEQFMQILHSTNFIKIISLINCLNKRNCVLRKEKKRLSTFDGDVLKKACRLCKETIAYAYDIPIEKADDYFLEKVNIDSNIA